MAAVQRIAGWKIASTEQLAGGGAQLLQFQFGWTPASCRAPFQRVGCASRTGTSRSSGASRWNWAQATRRAAPKRESRSAQRGGRPVTAPRGEFDLELPGQGSVTRWTLRLAVTMLVGGLVLIFLLVQATNNRLLYERYFTRLLWVNIAAAAVLALVILWGVYRLLSRLRRGKFGSLLIKLAAIFGLVGVLPGLLIYGCPTSSSRARSRAGSTSRWRARWNRA
jgi:hypothetical protein